MQSKALSESSVADISVAAAEQSGDWLDQYEDVVAQLGRLPERDHMMIVLRYVDGLSVQEIAASIEKPAETIRKQVFRAVQRLQRLLKGALL